VVHITFVSGGSVSASMFVLRGMCGLAKARGEQYFRSNPLSKSPMKLQVIFQKTVTAEALRPAKPADKVFSVAECDLLKF
jgi:hypothetical protein